MWTNLEGFSLTCTAGPITTRHRPRLPSARLQLMKALAIAFSPCLHSFRAFVSMRPTKRRRCAISHASGIRATPEAFETHSLTVPAKFDLGTSVCSYGFFMLEPNRWMPHSESCSNRLCITPARCTCGHTILSVFKRRPCQTSTPDGSSASASRPSLLRSVPMTASVHTSENT